MNKIKLLGLVAIPLLFSGCWNTGQGEKIGQVVRINEQSGLFCKTVEVEIVRGGFNSGSGVNGQSLHFTIENNPQALDLVKKAMENGSEVKVNFHTELATFCRSDSEGVFGDSITLVQKSEQAESKATTADVKTEMLKALKLNNELIQKLIALQ